MSRFTVAVAVAAVLSVACRDQQPLQTRSIASPSYLISDGAHAGNPFVFLLPPLVPNPSAFFHAGTFNAALAPVVEVCRLNDDPRLHPAPPDPDAAHCTGAPVFGPAPMALGDQLYELDWDTQSPSPLDASGFYRIQVRGAAGASVLAFVDVDPVDQGMKNVRTGDVVQFQDGRTLPIKVRIEQGAFGATSDDHIERNVGNVTTTFTTNTGFAGLSFPDAWLPAAAVAAGITEVVVTIDRIPVGPGTEDATCFQSRMAAFEGCYRIKTDPDLHQFGAFSNPVVVGVCIQRPDFLGTTEPVEMYREEEFGDRTLTELQSVPAPFLNCDGFGGTQIGALRSDRGGLFRFASAGWRTLLRSAASLVTPRPLYAVDFGAGGSTDFFSRFGWLHTPLPSPTLVNCTGTPGGDQVDRGFYLPSYPGTLLDQVTLHFSARTAGTYTFALWAHSGTYDGKAIAFDSEMVTLTADDQANVAVTFQFNSAPVTSGSTVAFVIQQINGPTGGVTFYSVPVDDPGCPIVQTNDTTPPLSTFRRHGVNVQIQGAGPVAPPIP